MGLCISLVERGIIRWELFSVVYYARGSYSKLKTTHEKTSHNRISNLCIFKFSNLLNEL